MMDEGSMKQNGKSRFFRDLFLEGKAGRSTVILRVMSVFSIGYFALMFFLLWKSDNYLTLGSCLMCFAASVIACHLTYLDKKNAQTFFLIQMTMLFWIVFFVVFYGWDSGVQHYLYVLLLLNFAASYASTRLKLVRAVLLCIVRLGLYYYEETFGAIYGFEWIDGMWFQLINTIMIFLCMSVCIAVFSEDSLRLEEELMNANNRYKKLSGEDSLTGLMNRRSFLDYMKSYLEIKTEAGALHPLAIAVGDIDYFKKINDTYGHDCGDMVLRELSHMLKQYSEKQVIVCRWGGEEFIIAFLNQNGDEAQKLLSEFVDAVRRKKFTYGGENIKLTMTFGLTDYDFRKDLEYTINEADEKLYQGKENGRNRIIY